MISIRLLLALSLALLYATVSLISYAKTNDICSPLCMYSLFHFVRYVPLLADARIISDFGYTFTTNECARLVLFEMLSVLAIVLGYMFWNEGRSQTAHSQTIPINTSEFSSKVVLTVFALGVFGRIQFFQAKGGLSQMLSGIGQASFTSSGSGTGSRTFLQNLLLVAIAMQIERVGHVKSEDRGRRRSEMLRLFIMTVLAMASYLVIGKRSGTLSYLVLVFMGWNYLVERYGLSIVVSPKLLVSLIFGALVIVMAPALRTGAAYTLSLNSVFSSLSYLGRDMAVYKYFETHSFWNGVSYLSVPVSIVPSSIWAGKPIVDDGVYLRNIMAGYDLKPLCTLADVPIKNSYPFSSNGALYANFGLPGMLLAFFLYGIVLTVIYQSLIHNSSSLTFAIYYTVITSFELSALGLAQGFLSLTFIIPTFFFCRLMSSSNRLQRTREEKQFGLRYRYRHTSMRY